MNCYFFVFFFPFSVLFLYSLSMSFILEHVHARVLTVLNCNFRLLLPLTHVKHFVNTGLIKKKKCFRMEVVSAKMGDVFSLLPTEKKPCSRLKWEISFRVGAKVIWWWRAESTSCAYTHSICHELESAANHSI